MVVRAVAREIHDAIEQTPVQRRVRTFIKNEFVKRGTMPAGDSEAMKKQADSREEASSHEDSRTTFGSKVSSEEILHHFRSGDRPFYKSSEIAEAVDLSPSHAHRRLEELSERGKLKKIKINESVMWWHPRDAIVITRDDCGEYTAIDTTNQIASQGKTRSKALEMIADAIRLEQEASDADDHPEPVVPDGPWSDK
jgi:predicted RNase H-like HicB family nuclease